MRLRISLTATAVLAACVFAMAQTAVKIDLRGRSQELHLYGAPGNRPVILSSGDLGWEGLVVHVAEFLAARGYHVVGFNSRAYLSSFTNRDAALNPADVPVDYRALIAAARRQSSTRPILAGISEGAGLSVLAVTDVSVKPAVQGILALGLPDQNELGWRWQDFTIWMTKKVPNEPSFMVEDLIGEGQPAAARRNPLHPRRVCPAGTGQVHARARGRSENDVGD